MSGSAGLSRSNKVSAISAASPTASGSSPRVYIPVSPNALSPRSAEAVGDSSTLGSGSGLVSSIKNFKRKKNTRERLHPLESESPRYPRHYQQQRHLSVVPSSPSRYPDSPRAPKGALEDSDDEVIQLKRLNAHLASGETVEEWIRSYEVERSNFASFAMFTEVKLDEVQEGFVEQVGRPNAVEAAACCATLLKMPGIVGCYRTLLEKMLAGIQGAIYLPDASLPSIVTDSTSPDAMSALVQNFYARTPVDDVARIFQYVPFAHVQAVIAKVYATNSAMLDQLVNALQEQQGLLLLRRKGMGLDDPDYPVHVPLATSAQICRAITHNAASFSSSGREMILCAIVGLVDADSFRDVFEHFDLHGKMCFLHNLTYTEGMDQLELVVDVLPNAGESLFRLYLATSSGRVGDLPDEKALGGEVVPRASPKDVFFLKLLSTDMEFFFLSDLAVYLTEAQWLLLSKEYEKNDNERKARKLRRASMSGSDFDIEIEEDTNDGRPISQSSTAASIERFQMIMLNYLRHHRLSSAQLLQLVSNTFLLMLEEKELSQLIDKCWTCFPLDGQWAKALAVIQDLGNGRTPASPLDVNSEYVAAIRLKMLKTLFKMLSREERAAKRIQDLKDAATAAKNAPPDLSDLAVHISRMKANLKVRWLEAIMEYVLNETESSARLAALKQALQPFANGKMPPPPQQQSKDGRIGFQKMRREFALSQQQQKLSGGLGRRNSYVGVSSQLVWARFWHLMRQLHDAAADSDGIVTPWEGINPERPRDSLPNFLFPDTARITAKMSAAHHQEAFDAATIHAQFAYLLSHTSSPYERVAVTTSFDHGSIPRYTGKRPAPPPAHDTQVQTRKLQEEEDAAQLNRERRRLTQIRYRQKLKDHADTLEQQVQVLRDQVQKLEFQHQTISPPPLKRGGRSHARREFLQRAMAPDVIVENGRGVEAVLEYWRFVSLSQPTFEIRAANVEQGPEGFIVAKTKTKVVLCEEMLRHAFPKLGESERGRSLAVKLLTSDSRRVESRCSAGTMKKASPGRASVWKHTRVLSLSSESDWMTPMLRLLGNAEDLAFVFDGAYLTLDGRLNID
ncbi:hypothetical protein PHYSODRAFT_348663 [Phytophthora sojae]|uniref:Uncharacterized protein n=1 Tax=Phytophthora sojae (strain P6497) TaxID=1094619 RepID=G5AHN8_PHYSP|nr:hypothetical protein PHYSODRAFT_348663 [Phytophthora sojae]EGZ04959.1 hypothetical protein PHYSODRAFT_348663 [Phytophthora sojae]|eukprot:XP_009539589.1 hypothetical protein PHYSODRAFT_348663 [Phytophthora sojae]